MLYSQLRAFHFVAESGGFTAAAEMLNLTQPAISDQVRKLEATHDVLLFRRKGREVRLTETGKQLFQLTKPLFECVERIDEFMSESHAAPRGTLRIIADSAHHISELLSPFSVKFPNVFISIRTGNTDEVLSALRNYDADIGVVGLTNPGPEFELRPLGASPITAFVARGHPLAGAQIEFASLVEHPLIFRERGSKTRQKLEEAARKTGLRLRPIMEAEGREALREVVATGTGIGFVSEAEFGQDNRLAPLTITGMDSDMSESLICLRQRKDLRLINAFWETAAL